MFPGQGRGNDMAKMMKQMGIDVDEIDADRVVVEMGDKKFVFEDPELSRMDMQGTEMFQLQGDYSEIEDVSGEDVELVMEKADVSEEEARAALKDADDPADAIMELQ